MEYFKSTAIAIQDECSLYLLEYGDVPGFDAIKGRDKGESDYFS